MKRVTDNAVRLSNDVVRDASMIGRDSERLAFAAREQWETWAGAGRAAPRVMRVIAEGASLLALYRWHLMRAKIGGFDHVPDDVHRVLAARAKAACIELRGGVLKIGQIASCRPDLVGPIWARELAELQDRVPPVDTALIVARIEADLGAPIAELFARFDETPVAAASLAQVHLAALADGREVAVKVQVPGIDEVIEADIAALRALAMVAGDLLPGADIFAGELGVSLKKELDYAHEADSAREVATQVAAPLFVPGVIDSHSKGAVLTTDRVDGARLGEYLEAAAPDERKRVIGAMIADVARAVFVHGVVHADPHPGNFLVCADGRIAVLDFGCVLRLDPIERKGYAKLLGYVFAGQPEKVASALEDLGFSGAHESLVAMADLICGAMKPGVAAADIDWSVQMKAMVEEATKMSRAGGVRVPAGFVLLGRVLATIAGYVVTYRPPLELFQLIAPAIARAA
ncbi:MAG TPA: AarF/UbiB family protein [Kofleriaceae bacterium]|nr:AarF/UbiB family protein [Kofleriaceae bacterium]